ncbi:ATPase [uncultured Peptoniphilus sp.]|uniref:ATPase n=1 Tax=uncultured Peptoniphilus sp. TaxID=254354 RepID=UPI002803F446|nr:ATPase [uncultured Peptoniphilus sp.]
MDIDYLNGQIENIRTKVNIEKGKLEIIEESLKNTEAELAEKRKYEDLLTKVVILFQKTARYARDQSKRQIEDIVSKCLQFIFETDIEFLIELSEKRSVPNAEFLVKSSYDEGYSVVTKPEISRGGGVIDIISIALRIAFIQIHKPEIEGPLILDEPGKHVSDDYIFNLGEFLNKSSSLFNRQIIMVTHNKHLAQICDKSYSVEIKNGISQVSLSSNDTRAGEIKE